MRDSNRVGRFIKTSPTGGETYRAYVPHPLPPDPPLDLTAVYPLLDRANIALGRLDGISLLLPDPSLFIYMYVRKEAVLSSQIEGTQSSLSDLLLFESAQVPGVPMDDVREVSRYMAAMRHGIDRIETLPLSLRLLREMHAELMKDARGAEKEPGEFRRSQNWIGGTRPGNARFVPPPADRLMECLDPFERFLYDDSVTLPVLVKAALIHHQFETIHPFLDGNGRLGRLLVTLFLYTEGVLREPILYLSLYLKTHRDRYYELLQSVRETGDWEEWVVFFLEGVEITSRQATQAAHNIIDLFDTDQKALEASGEATATTLQIFHALQRTPVTGAKALAQNCGIAHQTALRSLKTLRKMGIVKEVSGRKRGQIFSYSSYLAILSEGTEPLPN